MTFKKVYIHTESLGSDIVNRVLTFFPDAKIIDGDQNLPKIESFSEGKQVLIVKKFKGQFFKRCPGNTQKKALACCNYFVLNLGSQCNMNCSYCYLQSYLTDPTLTLYTNIDDAFEELRSMSKSLENFPLRVGTGEIMDSLSLDNLTLNSVKLIRFFNQYKNWHLEFKTKSDLVDTFLDEPHSGNVIVSWSINASEIVQKEEHGTASLDARLRAARRCLDRGFKVAFHIDPLIYYPDWESGYKDLVKQVTSLFEPKDISVVSIGALRFKPEQKAIMRERFPLSSLVNSAEMFRSESGKMRYDFHLRNKMFRFVLDEFEKQSLSKVDKYNSFLCMETPESWISSYNSLPTHKPELQKLFVPAGTRAIASVD